MQGGQTERLFQRRMGPGGDRYRTVSGLPTGHSEFLHLEMGLLISLDCYGGYEVTDKAMRSNCRVLSLCRQTCSVPVLCRLPWGSSVS